MHKKSFARHNEDIKCKGLKWNNVRVIENDYEEKLNIFCEFSYLNLQGKYTASSIVLKMDNVNVISLLIIITLFYIKVVSIYIIHIAY